MTPEESLRQVIRMSESNKTVFDFETYELYVDARLSEGEEIVPKTMFDRLKKEFAFCFKKRVDTDS